MSAGQELESLTEEIFRRLTSNPARSGAVSVERNVMLDGADGPRQIDIVLRSKAGPIELVTIIECKDYNRTITVTTLDALESVLHDVQANKAILVSRGGFSKTAMRKAKRLGIGLYRANQLANVEEVAFQVPMYIREVAPTDFKANGHVHLEAGISLSRDAMFRLNDSDLIALLRDDMVAGSPEDATAGRHVWTPSKISPPWFIRDDEGKRWDFEDLEMSYMLKERHFFGYLSEISTALYLRDELDESETILFKSEDVMINYEEAFSSFDGPDDLPAVPVITVTAVGLPDPEQLASNTTWYVKPA